jgi:hypothetical protein
MEYGICAKCGKKFWLEKHHIYPQSQFDDDENIIYLCPNCHTDYHLKLGKPKSKDKSFYFSFYMSWIWGIIILLVIIYLIKLIL